MIKILKHIIQFYKNRIIKNAAANLGVKYKSYQDILIKIENAANDAYDGINKLKEAFKSFKEIKRDIKALKAAQDLDK